VTRCPECGARTRGALTCPACGVELGEPLSVLDLEDAELGIRAEDRYAAVPPGPRLIPRRVHDQSTGAPLLLLGALVAFFALGAWLDSTGSDEQSPTPTERPAPVLDRATGATLLLFGKEGVATLDVDERTTRPLPGAERLGVPAAAASTGGDVVVIDDTAAVRLPGSRRPPVTLGPAGDVFTSARPGHVWLVVSGPGGTSVAREINLTTPGVATAELTIEGSVLGVVSRGLVVELPSEALEVVAPDGAPPRRLGDSTIFVAAGGDVVASRPVECTAGTCDLLIDDVAAGRRRVYRVGGLATGGTELSASSPDGGRVVVLRSDGLETRGVLVDVRLATITPFRARPVRQNPSRAPALAWSPDGEWLFVATVRSGIDAVDADGQVYRIEAELPDFDAIVAR
jgi:hypothetical protein